MKRFLTYIAVLISVAGFSQISAEIDTASIRIGEQFQYKILVDKINDVRLPKLENLNGLEIISEDKIDTINNTLIKKYILTGFDSGAFYIPSQQIFIKNQAYLTDSLLVNVATIAVDTTKIKKFPIKGIKAEPYQFDDFKQYLWYVLALLILIGLLVYYFVFRKKEQEKKEKTIVPILAPYEEAIQKLQELDEKLLWQNNHIKKYYSELTEIIRVFIERELKVPALERTTDELMDALKDFNIIKSIEIDKETLQKLKELLQESDLVKFAKSKPLSHEIEEDRKDAESIVSNLKQKLKEEENAE